MASDESWKDLRDQIYRQFTILESISVEKMLRVSENSDAKISVADTTDKILLPCDLQKSDKIELLEGLTTQVIENEDESWFIIETLSERRETFIPFITDVLILSSEKAPHLAFEDTLNDWKELWKGKKGRLDSYQQRGLLGELITLRFLMAHSSSVINYWSGPTGGIHDFTSDRVHVEVKTTTRQPPTVRISQVGQTAPLHGSTDLGLIVIGLERGHELSLVSVLEEIRGEINDPLLSNQFEKVLRKSGFRDIHSQYYLSEYNVSFVEIHWITPESPVLDPQKLGEIPSTVKNIQYDLEVYAMSLAAVTVDIWRDISNRLVE